jgi:hypothetical protein
MNNHRLGHHKKQSKRNTKKTTSIPRPNAKACKDANSMSFFHIDLCTAIFHFIYRAGAEKVTTVVGNGTAL